MSYRRKREINGNVIEIVVCLVAIVIDIVLVFALKDGAPKNRWLWLPLISLGLGLVALWGAIMWEYESVFIKALQIIWGVIRGIIVVAAYFKATSGFWAVLGAIFLCGFMFILNAMPFMMCGVMMGYNDGTGVSSTPKTKRYSIPKIYSNTSSNSNRSVYAPNKDDKIPSRPRQGDLASYFRSSACVPMSGAGMYFWYSSPSMNSSYGSHSNYKITGTIGIKKQSVEAFHVTSTDMDHYLGSVNDDIKRYAQEIMSRYHRDYPDDDTEFCIDIDLHLTVVDW